MFVFGRNGSPTYSFFRTSQTSPHTKQPREEPRGVPPLRRSAPGRSSAPWSDPLEVAPPGPTWGGSGGCTYFPPPNGSSSASVAPGPDCLAPGPWSSHRTETIRYDWMPITYGGWRVVALQLTNEFVQYQDLPLAWWFLDTS